MKIKSNFQLKTSKHVKINFTPSKSTLASQNNKTSGTCPLNKIFLHFSYAVKGDKKREIWQKRK